MSQETDPKFLDLLKAYFENAQAGQHGPMFARVESYNHETQAANVKPLVRLPVDGVFVDAPILQNVRVRWPGGSADGNGGALTFPLDAGDVGELVPLSADFSNWIASGTEDQDAATEARYQLESCVFKPLYRPLNNPLPSGCVHATCPVFSGNPVLLGDSTASEFVALASLVLTELQAIQTWASAHVHTGVTTGPGSSGAPATPMPNPGSTAATKVKAK